MGATMGAVTTAITTAGADASTQGAIVIGAGIAVGLVFWGAKLLWTKFKSMAK